LSKVFQNNKSKIEGKNMKIYTETTKLQDFNFWAGALETVEFLTNKDFNQLEEILEEMYSEGIADTAVNALFWFERDIIAEWIGYRDWEDLVENRG
jgi:hypothetical protein